MNKEEKIAWHKNNGFCWTCVELEKDCECDYFSEGPPRLETYKINGWQNKRITDYDYMVCDKHGAVLNDYEVKGCPLCENIKLAEMERHTEKVMKIKKYCRGVAWYSVRPREGDYSDELFRKRILKFLQSKKISEYLCCFEWKHNQGDTLGIHAHMLILPKDKYFRQHITRQKENWWNLDLNRQLKIIVNKEVILDKIGYMTGKLFVGDTLKEKEKMLDKLKREELGWTQMEQNGFCDFCDGL